MLKCDTCGLVKSESEFTINVRSKTDPNKIYYKKTCNSCRAKKQKIWANNEGKEYVLNYKITSEQKEKYNKNRRMKDMKRKEVLIEMLGGKCESCGTTKNLQFDHKNPSEKSFNISCVLSERTFKELEKCELRCSNCHLEKTKNDYLSGILYPGISEDRIDT